MRNIRLYIGGIRADLDSKVNLPFTFETSKADMPTAVKNSYSKTISLPATENNRTLFGGLWHLDSMVLNAGRGIGNQFNPLKKVDFLLFSDEMVIERGYCQLNTIERKGRSYTFNISLFGGLGEFFYNLAYDSEGESRSMASLDFGADLGFTINAAKVQAVWDDLLNGNFPTIAFVPMHNGVPDSIDADKALISGGGLPASVVDGGATYGAKDGYLLAKLNRKYTEWEIRDLRSYLQRPALRLKDFILACANPANNGGWTLNLDDRFFNLQNPYYTHTYILMPQLNVEEETEDICDDGAVGTVTEQMTQEVITDVLTPASSCMTIVGNEVDMSGVASNAYLTLNIPVQAKILNLANSGDLFLSVRGTAKTYLPSLCFQAVAYDDNNSVLATSNRYVLLSKNHRNEIPSDDQAVGNLLPTKTVTCSDAQITGCFKYISGEYVFTQDETNAKEFILQIERIPRPSTVNKKVHIEITFSRTEKWQSWLGWTSSSIRLNKQRRGNASSAVYSASANLRLSVNTGQMNSLKLVEPTQYASDSYVSQQALMESMDCTPLDLLLSITKSFGLMWLQDNKSKTLSLLTRGRYYNGEVRDIHERIDYSKSMKVLPVTAESNLYTLENEYPETTLSQKYEQEYGRVYGGVKLNVGYDFTQKAVEMMDKVKLKGLVDGALNGTGYWEYFKSSNAIIPAIAEGLKLTYYYDHDGETDTKDVEYNLFSVDALNKMSSPALGVASKNEDGEESSVDIAPALVFFTGIRLEDNFALSDDVSAMATLNNNPCWIWKRPFLPARVPLFRRVAEFSGEVYSLDFGTPKEKYYTSEFSLAPEQALFARFWEDYLTDLLSRDTKKVTCNVIFPPHLDMREEMRCFYLFDRSLWVLNKVTDYDPSKTESVKCEFIRVLSAEAYHTNGQGGNRGDFNDDFNNSFDNL